MNMGFQNTHEIDHTLEGRLGRLESSVESLTRDVQSLTEVVRTRGTTNWNVIFSGVLVLITLIGGYVGLPIINISDQMERDRTSVQHQVENLQSEIRELHKKDAIAHRNLDESIQREMRDLDDGVQREMRLLDAEQDQKINGLGESVKDLQVWKENWASRVLPLDSNQSTRIEHNEQTIKEYKEKCNSLEQRLRALEYNNHSPPQPR